MNTLKRFSVLLLFVILLVSIVGCTVDSQKPTEIISYSVQPTYESTQVTIIPDTSEISNPSTFDLSTIPAYSDIPYVAINNNTPFFTASDYTTESYEYYSSLDSLGRCGPAIANIGQDLMPTEKRGDISSVKPTGWHSVQYECVDGKSLYNRCHLIGFQLTAENANERNLITGTRYMNVDGMLPFENMVADYIKETNNHVLYRVTPIFEGNNLIAAGVLMEAYSVEDSGDGIAYCVFCYNNQPNITIDYTNGDSYLSESQQPTQTPVLYTYILNTNTLKFHISTCSSVDKISEKNREEYTGAREDLIRQGYEPCGSCNP